MFRQLNLRSFLVFLGRNKLYTAINIFGLSVSLMFVIVIADYTLRQLTRDDIHSKADRIFAVHDERGLSSGYYLQKYLLDRYPEIESTCSVSSSGWATDETEPLQAGTQQFAATALYADSTFFQVFDFPLVEGDRDQALAARNSVVLSESFARKAFGTFNPMGQVLRLTWNEKPKEFVVSGIIRDIDNSVVPNQDIILRAERLTELNGANNEEMQNAGAVVTFVLVREGADLQVKVPDMLSYFKEIYWLYQGNVSSQVVLTPLRELYFLQIPWNQLNHGSWVFVMILIGIGFGILAFAVVNYINLTVAQTGFRAREMAMRRLLGSSRSEVIAKLMLESTLMCAAAFAFALSLATAVEPYASQLLESRVDIMGDLTGGIATAYVGLVLLLGCLAGIVPAIVISRYKPLDVMNGSLRRRTKMTYSNVLITLQSFVTIVLLISTLAISLQIRHLINAPLGYNTKDIINIPSEKFRNYGEIQQFRDALQQLPCVEMFAMGCGTPHDGGNNNTMSYGPDRMVSFQVLIGDSVYFRMFGFEVLADYHNPKAYMFNQQAFRELEVPEDATQMKLGPDYSWQYDIGGVVRDFQMQTVLDKPVAVMMRNIGNFDRYLKDGVFDGDYPWNILIKTRGDQQKAFAAVRETFGKISDPSFFGGEYLEEEIARDFAVQRRLLRIVGVFTFVAILISALGLLAMSTYYIQQKRQEVAVRKVFGSTGSEVLGRLVGHFMRMVIIAFVVAVPVAWYGLSRWLEEYSLRIALSPLIFLAAGLFTAAVAFAVVFWQSRRAANANPVESIKG